MSTIKLRRATAEDSALVWRWRNDPVTRSMFRTSHEIPWEEHARWYEKAIADPHKVLLMALQGDAPAGVVRFDLNGKGTAEVSINVDPAQRGQGLGSTILAQACRHVIDELGLARLCAEIKAENAASAAIFRKAGFVFQGKAENMSTFVLTRLGAGERSEG